MKHSRVTAYRALTALGPWWLAAVVVPLALLSGCGIAPPKYAFEMPGIGPSNEQQIVWPSRPEVPRYSFIGHLYGESNTAKGDPDRSGFASFLATVVGLDEKASDVVDMIQPQQVCSDSLGRVYVADSGRQAIFVFDEKLGEFFIWNETTLNIPFLSPVGVVFAADTIWVTDSELSLIYRLDLQGNLIGTAGKGIVGRPTGIAYDSDSGRIFVSDTEESNIKVFDLDGSLVDVWGNTGSSDGGLNRPTFIAYRDGRLYVSDSLNARIQVFDALGDYRGTLGQRGLFVGNLARPKGIALDSDGNVYVSEGYYDYVVIYNESGELLMSLGGSGVGVGQFSQPTGLWVDDRDRVFVSDMLNRRISMFQYLGEN